MDTSKEGEADDMVGLTPARQDALVHDLILVVKSAMAKVSARDQMWCDIIAKAEKDIKNMVSEAAKARNGSGGS